MTQKRILGALVAIATIVSVAAAQAQTAMKGKLYAFHTEPSGECPGLDWHAYIEEDNTLTGLVAWDHLQHSAKFNGSIGTDGTFLAQAQETGGTRTATVSGKLWPTVLQIRVDHSGTGCDGVYWNLQRAPALTATNPG
jgi:hypothetical protein